MELFAVIFYSFDFKRENIYDSWDYFIVIEWVVIGICKQLRTKHDFEGFYFLL